MKKNLLSLLIALPFFAISQTFVSTSPENKNVILEEFTGISCQFCPDGHKIAQDLKDLYPNDVFLINIHTGGYASPQGSGTDFNTPFGTSLANQAGVTGYPAGTVNRHVFSGGATSMSRSAWSSSATQMMSQSSPVNVGIQASVNMSTRVLSVDVEVYYTGNQTVSSNKLNIAVLQENVPGPQSGGTTYNPSAILPDGRYNHKHMLRHLMTGQYGVPITNISQGSLYSNNFTWNVPNKLSGYNLSPEIDLTNLTIVAFVSEGNQEILSGTEVNPTVVFTNQFDANLTSVNAQDIVCANSNNIEVSFRNFGNQNLTSLEIEYSVGGGIAQTYNWSGNLSPGATETVSINNVSFTPVVNNQVTISLKNPNGNTDQNLANNNSSTQFYHYQSYGIVSSGHSTGNCSFEITTDQYASETSWEIIDDNGNVLSSGGPYSSQGTFNSNFNLPSGCYSLYVYDSYGDGITGGGYTLRDSNGDVIHQKYNFNGSKDQDFFEMGSSTNVLEEINSNIYLFPNPCTGILNIDGSFDKIMIYNSLGTLVYEGFSNTIDLSKLNNGIYSTIVRTDKGIYRDLIILSK